MNLYIEAVLYSLQMILTFMVAGPKLVQAERQRTLSRNPAWVFSNPEFIATHRKAPLAPLRLACLISLLVLVLALSIGSNWLLFAVHIPVFVLLLIVLALYFGKIEEKVRIRIPKDSIQRAPLVPRSTFRFLSLWSLLPLFAILLTALSLNGFGYFSEALSQKRALGNISFLVLVSGISLFGIIHTIKRKPYRTRVETDNQGRKFELRLVLVAAYFLIFVGFYYTAGSFGQNPIFPSPPTMLHAYFENAAFPWKSFFEEFQYRVVDYSATLFILILLIWIATNKFYQKILAVQFEKSVEPP